jgi:hypothetical protein
MKPQPLKAVAKLCNPFKKSCWYGLEKPITREEVKACIESGYAPATIRGGHIRKIADFVQNGWENPIQIDVGVPALHCNPKWPVTDGNHRLAAAIYRKNPEISAEISGDIEHAKSLGLNP